MIVSVDPGGATGVCQLWRAGSFNTFTVDNGFDGMSDMLSELLDRPLFSAESLDAVVIENFVPRGGALSIQLDALHIIGAVKHECRQRHIPLILQTPTQAKSFASNDHLKAVGWYTVGADHERDAARHMLVFLAGPKSGRGTLPDAYLYTPERTRILTALAAM